MHHVKFNFILPDVIITIIVMLIILSVGAFAFFIIIQETTSIFDSSSKYFTPVGTNPNTFTLPENTDEIILVTETYVDGTSSTLSKSNYTWTYSSPSVIQVNITGG